MQFSGFTLKILNLTACVEVKETLCRNAFIGKFDTGLPAGPKLLLLRNILFTDLLMQTTSGFVWLN